MGKKRFIFFAVISVLIAGLLFFTAFLNVSSYRNNYLSSMATNNYIVLDSVVSKIEYALGYGKSMENYYGIESIFDEAGRYCNVESRFITNISGEHMYGDELPQNFASHAEELRLSEEDVIYWTDDSRQFILTKVMKNGVHEACFGISYDSDELYDLVKPEISRVYRHAGFAALAGILLFAALFFFTKHGYVLKKLLMITIPVIILANLLFAGRSYFTFTEGYYTMMDKSASLLLEKVRDDISKVVSNGIPYNELNDMDTYFQRMVENNDQVDQVRLAFSLPDNGYSVELKRDALGKNAFLTADISQDYVNDKIRSVIMSIAAAVITSIMIAAEVLVFVMDIMQNPQKRRKRITIERNDTTWQSIGVIRGLSFAFAFFRYMSMAFMSIVLTQIYQPVVLFGREIPYDILMSFPMSAQIFVSMITAYLSGSVITRFSWKPVALTGILTMSAGTFASALADAPLQFIAAQMIVGIGLGFVKTALDVYVVVVASEEDMDRYTSNSNSSIVVGMSCSASIGAGIAGVFGYSGAYIVMSVMGVFVALLMLIFGQDVKQLTKADDKKEHGEKKKLLSLKDIDFGFVRYILFMILPYFFTMMFVDYFFPVYSDGHGLSTDMIGYVMLAYGIVTSYIGAFLCNIVSRRFTPVRMMSILLLILGGSFFLFGVKDKIVFAVIIVLLIGASDGIMPSMQFDYLYNLPLSKRLGFSKTLGIEGFFSSAIGGVAPLVFGVVMMRGTKGLLLVAAFLAFCAVCFSFFDKRKGRCGDAENT